MQVNEDKKKYGRNWRSKERKKEATKKKEGLPAKSCDPLLTYRQILMSIGESKPQ